MKPLTAAILEKITRTNDGERDFTRWWQKVNCPYCLDQRHLAIKRIWAEVGHIPMDVNVADYYLSERRLDVVYIRCDCHESSNLKGEEAAPGKRFQNYFGERIGTHWYGRRIMEHRHSLGRMLQEGYRPGSDGHMHSSEAHEIWDGDSIPDPPEHSLDDDMSAFYDGRGEGL